MTSQKSWVASLRPRPGRSMTTTSTPTPPMNEWTNPPAEFDFRSDTFTAPTPSMLESLQSASLGDDVYGESTTTNRLCLRIAKLFDKPAALFVLSGTMGNQLCLRALLQQPPYSILCDHRAHIYRSEAGAAAVLSQAHITPVVPRNGLHLTLEDVQEHAIISTNMHYAPTQVIFIENTLWSVIHPLSEFRRITRFARENGIRVHLDGARLWNACSVPGAPSLAEYAAEADSVSVCVSKSLGAPVGGFVLGSQEMVTKCNHFKKLLGGGIRQAGVLTAMADVAVTEVWERGRLQEANAYAQEVERLWKGLGGEVLLPVQTNTVWVDLEKRGVGEEVWRRVGKDMGVKLRGSRVMMHYQNSWRAVERLGDVMREVCRRADEKGAGPRDEEAAERAPAVGNPNLSKL